MTQNSSTDGRHNSATLHKPKPICLFHHIVNFIKIYYCGQYTAVKYTVGKLGLSFSCDISKL